MSYKKASCLLAALTLSVALVGCSKSDTSETDIQLTHEHPESKPVDARVQSVAATPAPSLNMKVDVKSHNATIHFTTTNFKISPEHYSHPHIPGEGHIHLFVDGNPTKVAVKDATYKLNNLTPGHHKLKASLHTNNHQPYNVEDAIEFDVK